MKITQLVWTCLLALPTILTALQNSATFADEYVLTHNVRFVPNRPFQEGNIKYPIKLNKWGIRGSKESAVQSVLKGMEVCEAQQQSGCDDSSGTLNFSLLDQSSGVKLESNDLQKDLSLSRKELIERQGINP